MAAHVPGAFSKSDRELLAKHPCDMAGRRISRGQIRRGAPPSAGNIQSTQLVVVVQRSRDRTPSERLMLFLLRGYLMR